MIEKVGDPNFTNALVHEKSPYLKQHAHNPVNWYGWNDRVFQKARDEEKPVFLSIGYATCHWCHVMANECFEDLEIAEILNNYYVSIKVDREERPDIDAFYMQAAQLLIRSGGWPLTIIMTPNKEPFFAGTYIPKVSSPGRIGLLELLAEVTDVWNNKKDRLTRSVHSIRQAMEKINRGSKEGEQEIDHSVHDTAYHRIKEEFDADFGGFGKAPKFPTPHKLRFLVRYALRSGEDFAREMMSKTLSAMQSGGIYDHLGFGFHRYSTDAEWHLPHFEKMLYDQAALALTYVEAWKCVGRDDYLVTARNTLRYVLRSLKSPEGGFYSAEDADTEEGEGFFYTWPYIELRHHLKSRIEEYSECFRLSPNGNMDDEASGRPVPRNIFHKDREQVPEDFDEIRSRLFDIREQRSKPLTDTKILTDWNGLIISALAICGRVCGEASFLSFAKKAVQFIEDRLVTNNGLLLHRFAEGEAAIPAFLEDYAFLVQGLLDLHQSTLESKWFKKALHYMDQCIDGFWDSQAGGFFMTRKEHSELAFRQKQIYDSAIPSGNAAAFGCLVRLSRMTGIDRYESLAKTMLGSFSSSIRLVPEANLGFLLWNEMLSSGSQDLVIVSELDEEEIAQKIKPVTDRFRPYLNIVLLRPGSAENEVFPFYKNFLLQQNETTYYYCSDFVCNKPVTSLDELLEVMDS